VILEFRIAQHYGPKAFVPRRQFQSLLQRRVEAGGCIEITGPAGPQPGRKPKFVTTI